MGLIKTGFGAIGKLIVVAGLLFVFLCGMAGVVYMSLSGEEILVPELVGKDFVESEKELAGLGLKIKRRADRASTEKMNTVLEQSPRSGETVKTGQLIFVVVSKETTQGDDAPKSLIKDSGADDTKKIEEMISDKPKKARTNSNSKKKTETSKDANSNAKANSSGEKAANENNSNATKKSDKEDQKKADDSKSSDKAKEPSSGSVKQQPPSNKKKEPVSNPRSQPKN